MDLQDAEETDTGHTAPDNDTDCEDPILNRGPSAKRQRSVPEQTDSAETLGSHTTTTMSDATDHLLDQWGEAAKDATRSEVELLQRFSSIIKSGRLPKMRLSQLNSITEIINGAILRAPLHKPLRRKQIRLLEILPCLSFDGLVTCKLTTVDLEQQPEFYSLSYVWGNPEDTKKVKINSHVILVTKNLASFLSHVQNSNSTSSKFWIDAVCINQEDIEEKSRQIQLMGDIYQRAKCVWSWLGPADGVIDSGLSLLSSMSSKSIFGTEWVHRSMQDPPKWDLEWMEDAGLLEHYKPEPSTDTKWPNHPSKKWTAIAFILESEYWQRVRIVQEVALAKRQTIICGRASLEGPILAAFGLYFTALAKRPPVCDPKIDFSRALIFKYISALNSDSLITTQLRFRLEETRPLISYVWQISQYCRAKNPRDLVYGLLALTKSPIIPDYGKSVAKVFLEWFFEHLENLKNPELMLTAGIGTTANMPPDSERVELPSWLPDLTRSRYVYSTSMRSSIPVDLQTKIDLDPGKTEAPRICGTELLRVYGITCDAVKLVPEPRQDADDEQFHGLDVGPRFDKSLSRLVLGVCSAVPVVLPNVSCDVLTPRIVSGVPILQALFRLVTEDREFPTRKPLAIQNSTTNRLARQFLFFIMESKPSSISQVDAQWILGRMGNEVVEPFFEGEFYRALVYPGLDDRQASALAG